MAGRTLTKEDFEEGKTGKEKEVDTSGKEFPADNEVPVDQEFDAEGNPVEKEPAPGEKPGEKKTAKEGETPPEVPEFKPKHKTWEETEKARTTLEKDFHTKSTENAELRRKLDKYEKPVEPPKTTTIDDKITQIYDDARKEIKAIPIEYDTEGKPTAESRENYERQSWVIMGKANRKVSRLEIEEFEGARTKHQTTVSKLYNQATKAGLKSDDELEMVGTAFDRTDPNLDTETRISQAVENTQQRVGRLREGFVQKIEKDTKEKKEMDTLGRGSSRTGASKDTKPTERVSMADQLAQTTESRRLKKDDLY